VIGHISLDTLMEKKLLIDSLPHTDLLHNGSIVGHYSYRATGVDSDGLCSVANDDGSPPEYPIRIIANRHTRMLPGSSIRDTETAFTRCFLKSLPPVKARKTEIEGRSHARPPQYCQPTESTVDTFYVDIKSAYQSIYERMSWRVRYLRNQYFSNDEDKLVYPFPKEWKSGRSYVVTGALPHSVHFVYDHKVLVRPAYNRFSNPNLVAAVWDVLASIARFAVDVFHARYFNIDGAVIPQSQFYKYADFLSSLGLEFGVKCHGMARILNLAVWEIGETKTKRYGIANQPIRTDAIPITMQEAKWVLARFARM
jgi:hypothetical protein